jgi:HAMP domain-containing protein
MTIVKPNLKISLYTRFMIAITFILIFLVGSILFLIERREVRTIFEASKSRGTLMARSIARLNLESLTFWDAVGIKNNIEREVDEGLVYVVVYDRFRSPYVFNDRIRANEEITCCSRLPARVSADTSAADRRSFHLDGKSVPIIEIEVPVFAEGSTDFWGSVKVGLSLEENQKEIRRTRLMLILIGWSGFLLGLIGAGLLAKRITGPLKKLVEGTERISRGDFTQTISIGSRDEVGELAQSFNSMTNDLLEMRRRIEDANRRLIQAEKLASIGRISATIAHEIRNP